jgi:dTDP-4-amino-4,6-dideoxygalactose transaminase
MDEIQAAVLCMKLAHVDDWNAERRQIVARYAAATQAPAGIVGTGDPTNACHLAILRTSHRPAAVDAMSVAGVATAVHYPILDCDQVSESGLPGRRPPLPESERASAEILTLPCYPGLTEAEIDQVSGALTKITCAAR